MSDLSTRLGSVDLFIINKYHALLLNWYRVYATVEEVNHHNDNHVGL